MSDAGFSRMLGSPPDNPFSQVPLSPLGPSPGLPFDPIAETVTDSAQTHPIFANLQLVKPKWKDLDLWAEQPSSWTAKFPSESQSLDQVEKKRQNVIYGNFIEYDGQIPFKHFL